LFVGRFEVAVHLSGGRRIFRMRGAGAGFGESAGARGTPIENALAYNASLAEANKPSRRL